MSIEEDRNKNSTYNQLRLEFASCSFLLSKVGWMWWFHLDVAMILMMIVGYRRVVCIGIGGVVRNMT